MMQEMILSAGIDIGTTTTHLVVSRLGIQTTEAFGTVPRAQIASKEILYQSPVYFTPLLADGDIDGKAVAAILEREYKAAGLTPADLKSGAVIVTGESACKGNAAHVLQEISALAGSFVAAQAGSELESYLSGKGAGADRISAETGKRVANIDIGGGTTNISLFQDGECIDTCCLHIGGRLVKRVGKETAVSRPLAELITDRRLTIRNLENDRADLCRLCDLLAGYIFSALGFRDGDVPEMLVADHLLKPAAPPDILTFSGGVAACMKEQKPDFVYGDIGVLLGKAVKAQAEKCGCCVAVPPGDPIRATVIGAGQFSMEISGSTIEYADIRFPLKNLPCVCTLEQVGSEPCAICPTDFSAPTFSSVSALAEKIMQSSGKLLEKKIPLIVITQADCAKALGLCLKSRLPKRYPFLCADGVACKRGDYIDIGAPVAGGRAVPVVVKTLVFGG